MTGSALHDDYRPTPWPNVQIGVPEIRRYDVIDLEGAWVLLQGPIPRNGSSDAGFVVPDNACEQEILRADPKDLKSMVELIEALGGDVISVDGNRWGDFLRPVVGPLNVDLASKYSDYVAGWSEALNWGPVTHEELELRETKTPGEVRIHAAEVSYRVWRLQSIVRGLAGLIPLREDGMNNTEFPEPATWQQTSVVEEAFALSLQPFSPRVAFTSARSDKVSETLGTGTGRHPTAFEVAALQLYNAIVRGEKFKQCRNCQNPFTSQVGRSKSPNERARRRSDAEFCSPRCQKALEQRERRAAAKHAKSTSTKADKKTL